MYFASAGKTDGSRESFGTKVPFLQTLGVYIKELTTQTKNFRVQVEARLFRYIFLG